MTKSSQMPTISSSPAFLSKNHEDRHIFHSISEIMMRRHKKIISSVPILIMMVNQVISQVPVTNAIRLHTSSFIDRQSYSQESNNPKQISNQNDMFRSTSWNMFSVRGGYADFIEDANDDVEVFNYNRPASSPSSPSSPSSQDNNLNGDEEERYIQSQHQYSGRNNNDGSGRNYPPSQQSFDTRQQQLEQRDYPYASPNMDVNNRGTSSSNSQSNPWNEPMLPPADRRDSDPPDFPDNDSPPPFPMDQRQQQQQQRPPSSTRRQQPNNRPPPRQAPPPRRPPPRPPVQEEQQGTQSTPPLLDLEDFDKDLIFDGLKRMYRKKILPLEVSSRYGHFHSKPLSPPDFDSKPMVLLLGQYSVGKTSFIKYLLGRDFPGIRIGPEPTTDRFTTIMDGDMDKIIPGAALCSQSDRPFRGLSPFGNNFLSRFEGVEMDAPILHNITLVDTPGILSGTKQSDGRNYDYDAVMKWFAERADLIIIMFDAHKLDISDELKRVIEMMSPHADKVRVVLNKADSVSTQQLMRVYGALMWSLGKVMLTPEVCRVYIGSFWAAATKNVEQRTLLEREKLDLFTDIAQLPQNAVMRRINELVKRARSVKVHAYIIHYLRKQLPYTWGKRETQARLIRNLDREFVMCARRYELPRGDFPPVEPMRKILLEIKDLSEFKKLDKNMVKDMDKVFTVDIPQLLEKARGH